MMGNDKKKLVDLSIKNFQTLKGINGKKLGGLIYLI